MHLNGRVGNLGKKSISATTTWERGTVALSTACIALTTHQNPGSVQDLKETSFVEYNSGKVLVGSCVQNVVRPCSDHCFVLTAATLRRNNAGIFLIYIDKL